MSSSPSSSSDPPYECGSIPYRLPLQLHRAQLLPPAPNSSPSSSAPVADWLPDFGGASWVAYGAGELLAVTEMPSPRRETGEEASETTSSSHLDPWFRQVVELVPPSTSAPSGTVSAVRWCPALPSDGELAAAAAKVVYLFAPGPAGERDGGAFCWKQTNAIVETFVIEAISWTGSGDGLVVVGTHVAMWTRHNFNWEVAWRSKDVVPQNMVATTRFADGPVAAAACTMICAGESLSSCSEENNSVMVYLNHARSGLSTFQLRHPLAVCTIQWRPVNMDLLDKDHLDFKREVLMTYCLDGVVRLWSENDRYRTKKTRKGYHGLRNFRKSFHVIAMLDLKDSFAGALVTDISIQWAIYSGQITGIKGDKFELCLPDIEGNQPGVCEWLISTGPRFLVKFWSVHCLDDVSPPRYPRINPWKMQQLALSDKSISSDRFTIIKVLASRSHLSSPPTVCSLLYLTQDNVFVCSKIYNELFFNTPDSVLRNSTEGYFPLISCRTINQDGHASSIRQVCVHPYSLDGGLTASLDSSGMLFFWTVSTLPYFSCNMQTYVHPLWDNLGKVNINDFFLDIQQSCLSWAPSLVDRKRFFLIGSEHGVDLFMIDLGGIGKNIWCQQIATIPFHETDDVKGLPDEILTYPLASSCGKSFVSNEFVVYSVWRKNCLVLSWKVVLHLQCSCGSSCPEFSMDYDSSPEVEKSVGFFEGISYSVSIRPRSPVLSIFDDGDLTTFSMISPNIEALNFERHGCAGDLPAYHLVTGSTGGALKLWKMSQQLDSDLCNWELVGMLAAHQGPVQAIDVSSCGLRIASVSSDDNSTVPSLHIWEMLPITGGGSILLEDVILLHGLFVGAKWYSLGNGQLLLGVCMQNEFRIYSQRRPDVILHKNSRENHVWECIAAVHSFHDIKDFMWGPKLSAILVHEKHVSLFSQGAVSFLNNHVSGNSNAYSLDGRSEEPYAICYSFNTYKNLGSSRDLGQTERGSECYNLVDVAAKLAGPLSSCHQEVLLQHLNSGNWRRAHVAMMQLTETLNLSASKGSALHCRCGTPYTDTPVISLSDYFMDGIRNPFHQGKHWGEDYGVTSSLTQSNTHTDWRLETKSLNSSEKSWKFDFMQALDKKLNFDAFKEMDKVQLLAIADIIDDIRDASHSLYERLDEPGRRFWVAMQFQRLYQSRKSGYIVNMEEIRADSVSIAWAFQSDCQDDLLSFFLSTESNWMELRNLGVGLWYANFPQLKVKMEKLARIQYLKRKDPKDCALLYVALNRIPVLAGLFKISRDEKDKVLFSFLSRNFEEDKNKGAALKNAYVLMGRHQFELASAFFLLGGDRSSAVTVCAKNYGDEQLALVICRLVEGYEGPLEHHLVANILLPAAKEKGDYWLSGLLEWKLGNYLQSVKVLYNATVNSAATTSAAHCSHAISVDPRISQFCALLCTKSSFRTSVGEALSANIFKLSNAVALSALNKCGFPLEVMERLSSALKIDNKAYSSVKDGDQNIPSGILGSSFGQIFYLLPALTGKEIKYKFELHMASKYLSRLIDYHLQCPRCDPAREIISRMEFDDVGIEEFQLQIEKAVTMLESKFSLKFVDLAKVIFTYLSNIGLSFFSHLLLWPTKFSKEMEINSIVEDALLRHAKFILVANKEICKFVSRYVVYCYFTESLLYAAYNEAVADAHRSRRHGYYLAIVRSLLQISRLVLKRYYGEMFDKDENCLASLSVFDYFIQFAFTILMNNVKGTITLVSPILHTLANGQFSKEAVVKEFLRAMRQNAGQLSVFRVECFHGDLFRILHRKIEDSSDATSLSKSAYLNSSDVEKWHFVGVCLWIHFSNFAKHCFQETNAEKHDAVMDLVNQVIHLEGSLMADYSSFICSSMVRQFAFFVRQRLAKNMNTNAQFWLECIFSERRLLTDTHNEQIGKSVDVTSTPANDDEVSLFNFLFEVSMSSQDVCVRFVNEEVSCFPSKSKEVAKLWRDIQTDISIEHEIISWHGNMEGILKATGQSNVPEQGLIERVSEADNCDKSDKQSNQYHRAGYFQTPKELLKRNGELFEAICLNSVDNHQVAVAGNRKGLLFFNWGGNKNEEKLANYLWSQSDWPSNGWAGCESTPLPTFVSPGIGLGSKSGAHLGLGGATVGMASLAKPGRDLTGGGAFGIPGYAGIGASGLGWGEPEDFEFVDPPATVENIQSRALSRHPSQPLLLVGSSNTHVYLWEFGKERALATYGILPAANVPPPYVLASICAVQFDYYGHRFATAALDGTICTWQLEVGGRSNVHPTESSLFFSDHASGVSYVAACGSIVAATGCSSDGANVVLWDTLAPPSTCQASLVCHEGGARSLSVFDTEVGSGTVTPFIVTGGKGGDVALHDFRFNRAVRSKHHKSSDQGTDSMLWYIPKAHLGTVTSISTIPNTNFFLTGCKYGDVKLWDAKQSRLVCHWPKLHERPTFFQPNSRGFGGVVRDAVTDIQVLPQGFMTCGGDGSVKLIHLT